MRTSHNYRSIFNKQRFQISWNTDFTLNNNGLQTQLGRLILLTQLLFCQRKTCST